MQAENTDDERPDSPGRSIKVDFAVGVRPVAETITALAHELGADLIMLATHGLDGLARVFVGSVAERLVQHTVCPLFFLPIHEKRAPS